MMVYQFLLFHQHLRHLYQGLVLLKNKHKIHLHRLQQSEVLYLQVQKRLLLLLLHLMELKQEQKFHIHQKILFDHKFHQHNHYLVQLQQIHRRHRLCD